MEGRARRPASIVPRPGEGYETLQTLTGQGVMFVSGHNLNQDVREAEQTAKMSSGHMLYVTTVQVSEAPCLWLNEVVEKIKKRGGSARCHFGALYL